MQITRLRRGIPHRLQMRRIRIYTERCPHSQPAASHHDRLRLPPGL
ncbi:MAG: hypothetical protein EOO29_25985 [Comamonadaceae bacterium]|nr:MAG: hypothetical protein EOO29_25985 [Comamonadaceae bacterium]